MGQKQSKNVCELYGYEFDAKETIRMMSNNKVGMLMGVCIEKCNEMLSESSNVEQFIVLLEIECTELNRKIASTKHVNPRIMLIFVRDCFNHVLSFLRNNANAFMSHAELNVKLETIMREWMHLYANLTASVSMLIRQ